MQHNRNYDNVFMEAPRRLIEPPICQLVDELEDAYYKHWKLGLPYDFYGYNKKSTPEASKEQFDLLHGLFWTAHICLLHKQNLALPIDKQTPTSKYNDIFNDEGVKIDQMDTRASLKLRSSTPHFNNIKNMLREVMTDNQQKTWVDDL